MSDNENWQDAERDEDLYGPEDPDIQEQEDAEERSDGGLDADSAPTNMKSVTVPEWEEQRFRETALNMAAATVGATGNVNIILSAASEFVAFLRGEDRQLYPHRDEDGLMHLGPGVVGSHDGDMVFVGRRVYKYVETVQD